MSREDSYLDELVDVDLDTIPPTESFTIAIIPDTQYLSESYPTHFSSLANWLAANASDLNLQLVVHVGDVVQVGNTTQYDNADGPMATLFALGVPFIAAIGNHDYDASSGDFGDSRPATLWNFYFGPAEYTSQAWFDGDFKDAGASENMYLTATLGGRPTLVLSLECFPRAAVMAWADEIIADHPLHEVIVVTHSYLFNDGTRVEDGTAHGPGAYSVTDAMSGAHMWMGHFRHHHNVVAVVNGHHITTPPNINQRFDHDDNGNLAFQQFANWQNETEGGEGRVVLWTINTGTRRATRTVFNAAQNAYDTTSGNELDFPWTR